MGAEEDLKRAEEAKADAEASRKASPKHKGGLSADDTGRQSLPSSS